jgi:hypothetical protein
MGGKSDEMKTREEVDATIVHGKELGYWKNNAEEDYMTVPISVLKYITVMEELLCQEQEHPNRCGHCSPDGTLRSGDMEIICPYCNGSGEEHTPKPKQ